MIIFGKCIVLQLFYLLYDFTQENNALERRTRAASQNSDIKDFSKWGYINNYRFYKLKMHFSILNTFVSTGAQTTPQAICI